MERKAPKPEDLRQLKEVFSSIEELLQEVPQKNSFDVLVQIEQELENYRLTQTEEAQQFETAAASRLERLQKSIQSR
ncbi:hypothetical protein [Listeria costaricensis]|uniref:hypothetical protein n=1 Tax=Listeria costaricensis TaxID=2026604 RepID=UPI000C089A10|nr:hypothetical protein [Listeria costaricensis]